MFNRKQRQAEELRERQLEELRSNVERLEGADRPMSGEEADALSARHIAGMDVLREPTGAELTMMEAARTYNRARAARQRAFDAHREAEARAGALIRSTTEAAEEAERVFREARLAVRRAAES